jgi:hypothetical protein
MTYLWKFDEHSSRPSIFSPISTNARIYMPREQDPTSCGAITANSTKAHRRNLYIPLICNCSYPLSTSGNHGLSLARTFYLLAIILMAQKHIPGPVSDNLSTTTDTATYTRSFVINDAILDHCSVPAEHDKARGRHAPLGTRRDLFLAVS